MPYPGEYNQHVQIGQTPEYQRWLFLGLRDKRARDRIFIRVRRLSLGNPGDTRPVGEGVAELRIDYGPGYRVYYTWRDTLLVILLAGGDKKSQTRDIEQAKRLARGLSR